MQPLRRSFALPAMLALCAIAGCTTFLPDSGSTDPKNPSTEVDTTAMANQALSALSSGAFLTTAMGGMAALVGDPVSLATSYVDSVAAAAGCVSVSLDEGPPLVASATLLECPTEIGAISGALSVSVGASSLQIDVTDLSVGEETLSASIGVSVADLVNGTADLSLEYSGSLGEVSLDGGIILQGTSVEINASGTVNIDGVTASFSAIDVVIELGSCLPSGGTLTVDIPPDSATLTFLPTTPIDGVAELVLNGDSQSIVLDDPCN